MTGGVRERPGSAPPGVPVTERSDLRGKTPVALPTEGALSPYNMERGDLRGETPVALPTEGALSPYNREQH